MKLFTGSLAAGLVLIVSGAQAQVPGPYANGRAPYAAMSDFDAPYAGGPRYGSGPSLLPSIEVYSVLRDNGFSPLGIPRLRGFVYTIAVIDRSGEDGRLVINARNGRIIRFLPGYRGGIFANFNEEPPVMASILKQTPEYENSSAFDAKWMKVLKREVGGALLQRAAEFWRNSAQCQPTVRQPLRIPPRASERIRRGSICRRGCRLSKGLRGNVRHRRRSSSENSASAVRR